MSLKTSDASKSAGTRSCSNCSQNRKQSKQCPTYKSEQSRTVQANFTIPNYRSSWFQADRRPSAITQHKTQSTPQFQGLGSNSAISLVMGTEKAFDGFTSMLSPIMWLDKPSGPTTTRLTWSRSTWLKKSSLLILLVMATEKGMHG
jgi:hypothetical protein